MDRSQPVYCSVAVLVVAIGWFAGGCDEPSAWAGDEPTETDTTSTTAEENAEDPGDEEAENAPDERVERADTAGSDRSLVDRAMDPSVPLPERARGVFADIDFDPIPDDITENSHYVVSNEHHHRLYRPHIMDHGGVLLGVGTDQNYLMGAWAESPILLMMDFDEQVRNVHHLYGIVFEHVAEPDAFIEQWDDANYETIASWIEQRHSGDQQRIEALKETLEMSHQLIHARLKKTARVHRAEDIPTFVSDDDQFDFIRGLWQRGRVIPVRGDLTGDVAMQEIASALRELGLEVGLAYLSNAEQYFPYSPEYRRNIAVMPFGEEAKILRTRPMEALGLPEDGKYHYNIQPARKFAGWLVDNHVDNAKQMVSWYMTDPTRTDGLSFVRNDPVFTDAQPEIAPVGEAYDLTIDEEVPREEDRE